MRDVDEVASCGGCRTGSTRRSSVYFPSSTSPASVLGDFLSSGLGVLGRVLAVEPGAHRARGGRLRLDPPDVRPARHLPRGHPGHRVDEHAGGAALRPRAQQRRTRSRAAACRPATRRLVVYTSVHGHSSIEKAALLAGFGRENLRTHPGRRAPGDARRRPRRRDPRRPRPRRRPLRRRRHDRDHHHDGARPHRRDRRGRAPPRGCGSTSTRRWPGRRWCCPECRWMWRGVEAADSVVVNAHKWLGAAFDCSLYYVRDPEHLIRVMSTNPSYLQSSVDGQVTNLRDWGIPLGRRFRSLKLWFLLRGEGVSGIQRRLRRDMENARWLAEQVLSRARLAGAGPGGVADGVRPPRAAGDGRRRARPPHARLGRAAQPQRRGVRHPGEARRALDGAAGHRLVPDRASARRWRRCGRPSVMTVTSDAYCRPSSVAQWQAAFELGFDANPEVKRATCTPDDWLHGHE
jgi:hypothetical protein